MDSLMAAKTRLHVRPVTRTCRGCPIQDRARLLGLCSLCCTLVADRDGSLYVSLTPLNGGGWENVEAGRLAPVPQSLAAEW